MVATSGEATERAELPKRFLAAIDAAAMKAGLVGSDEYLDESRRATRPCTDDVGVDVAVEATRLEDVYSQDVLRRLVRSGGLDEAGSRA